MTTNRLALAAITIATRSALALALAVTPAWAQELSVSAVQKATATETAQKGVPPGDLAADAPASYLVKGGDTLWAISRLFLKSPWRWPELWGMNLSEIKNPHRIYPGQRLELVRGNGTALLRVASASAQESPVTTVKLSPRIRSSPLPDVALPTLNANSIEPFLTEPIIITEPEYANAPRIVSAQEGRVLLTRGDRAYARGPNGAPLMDDKAREKQFRVYRTATALKDPDTGEVLGYEAAYTGLATLVRSETTTEVTDTEGQRSTAIVPATIDIVSAKEEIRVGDRLFPEPVRMVQTYTPRAPKGTLEGRIVSVYGTAVVNAAQNQVVTINRGTRDGLEAGMVLAILKNGARVTDKQDEERPLLKLPNERNGLLMVFRPFERLSYGLILEITDSVRVGDRLAAPR